MLIPSEVSSHLLRILRYRVNISLEHHHNVRDLVGDSLHFYPAAQCLAQLVRICRSDGDFDWGVAAHPYPSDILNPAFWEAEDAVFRLDTPKITLKNMEVWPALLSSPDYLYRGESCDVNGIHYLNVEEYWKSLT